MAVVPKEDSSHTIVALEPSGAVRLRRRSRTPKRAIPRDVKQRVVLNLLSWYLRDNLPQLLPNSFETPPEVIPHIAQGWSNYAFVVNTDQGADLLVRMKERPAAEAAEHWSDYHKEAWITGALPAGVPTAKVLQRGIRYVGRGTGAQEYAFMVQSLLPYRNGWDLASGVDRCEMLLRLGSIARQINETPTKGYGSCFDASSESFACQTWSQCLAKLEGELKLELLCSEGIITLKDMRAILTRLEGLSGMRFEPRLYHADFIDNWGNVLVDDQGGVRAVIDWEMAGSGPALHTELGTTLYVMYRDGKSEELIASEFGAVLNGYGLSFGEFRDTLQYDMESLLLLHAIGKVQRYLRLKAAGELQEHAWRLQFAERAEQLVRRIAQASQPTLLTEL